MLCSISAAETSTCYLSESYTIKNNLMHSFTAPLIIVRITTDKQHAKQTARKLRAGKIYLLRNRSGYKLVVK